MNSGKKMTKVRMLRIVVFGAVGVVAYVAGYVSPSFDGRPASSVVESLATTAMSEEQLMDPFPDSEETALRLLPDTERRWRNYDAVELLAIDETLDEGIEQVSAMLEADPAGTLQQLARLPQDHPGEGNLAYPVSEYLETLPLEQAIPLVNLLKPKENLYASVSKSMALGAEEEGEIGELFNWWSVEADNEALASATSVAVSEALREDRSPEALEMVFQKASALPDGPVRDSLLKKIVLSSYPENLFLAGQLLSELPSTPGLDSAVAEFSAMVSKDYPEAGLEWAKTLHDDDMRKTYLEFIGERWREPGEEEYAEWQRVYEGMLEPGN